MEPSRCSLGALRASPSYIWRCSDSLGSGAFGEVFKGYHKVSGDAVAVKAFKSNFRYAAPQYLEQHTRELEILKTLNHPNIIRLIAVEPEIKEKTGPEAAGLVLVMELATDGTLFTECEKPENRFGFGDVAFLRVLAHLVSGLTYLRQNHSISHRDVKPSNILKTTAKDGQILYKLCDFGTARVLEEGEEFRSIVGTEEYLHPDIYNRAMMGGGPSVFASNCDLWSVAVTLYQCATGTLPFRPFGGPRANKMEMAQMITCKPPETISGVQRSQGAAVDWSDKFPDSCLMSSGLRPLVEKILIALFELDKRKQWSFDRFFQEANHVTKTKPTYCFDVQRAAPFTVYRAADASLLSAEIRRQTNIEKCDQRLLLGENWLDMTSLHAPSLKQETTAHRPIFVFSGTRCVSKLKLRNLPLEPEFSYSLDCDFDSARCVAALGVWLRRRIETYIEARNTMNTLIHTLRSAVSSKLELLDKRQGKSSTAWSYVQNVLELLDGCGHLDQDRKALLSRKVASAEQLNSDLGQFRAELITTRASLLAIEPVNQCKMDPTQSLEIESLNQSIRVVTDICSSFRKDRVMKIDVAPQDRNAVAWHKMLMQQLKTRWNDMLGCWEGKQWKGFRNEHNAAIPHLNNLVECDITLNRLSESLDRCDDMIDAFSSALQQIARDHVETDEKTNASREQSPALNGSSITDESINVMQDSVIKAVNEIVNIRNLTSGNQKLIDQLVNNAKR